MRAIFTGLLLALLLAPLSSPAALAADSAARQPAAPPLAGQPGGPTVEKKVAQSIAADDRNHIITAVYENDLIGSGKDGEYTNGARLTYIDLDAKFPGWAYRIANAVPTFDINQTSSIYYSIGQNMFTPRTILSKMPDPHDRPYAGFLYGSIGMATLTGNHSDEIEATFGVVGPYSLAANTQKWIHAHITGSPAPQGWSNQLHNEPALMLAWQRAYPETWARDLGGYSFSTSPYYGVTLGNVYTFANTGFNLRFRPGTSKWQDTPQRVRPAMPGTGFFEIPEKKWGWYLFAGVDARAVARNIFLDGNTFGDSYSVSKYPFVVDGNAGAALTYDQLRISYTLVYRTKEFHDQAAPQTFGAISIGYRF